MLNKATLIGNLGADPEIRTTNSGSRVATLRIATSERWTDKASGTKKETTEWHRVVIFNEHLVKVAEDYLVKGKTVYIEGKISTRKWEKDGIERYSTEIVLSNFDGKLVMIGKREGGGGGPDESAYGHTRDRDTGGGGRYDTDQGFGGGGGGGGREDFSADLDDEIPFVSCFDIK